MSRCRNLFFPALAALGVSVAVFGAPARASAEFNISFTSTPGSTIVFNPNNDSFQFNPQGGNSFVITGGGSGLSSGGPNSLNSLEGTITGAYQIGAITSPVAGLEVAAVTNLGAGAHQFVIDDGNGFNFTADIEWNQISTFSGGGTITSAGGVLNLKNFSYGGANQDLKNLAVENGANGGLVTVTFQFTPARSLTQLTTGLTNQSTSYSGSLFAPEGGPLPAPAPAGLVLLASGLPFLLVGRAFRRRTAQESATLAA